MFALLSLILAAAVAAQTISPTVQHAKRTHLPVGWSRVRRHALDAVLPLRIGLVQLNVEMTTLEQLLNDVSHPESLNYGQHWSPARVLQHFAPSDESVHAVVSWVYGHGFAKERVRVSKTKGWVTVNATVAETESLLGTEYHVFVHDATGTEHVACDSYHLPAHVAPHIDLITPSTDFSAILSKRQTDGLPTETSLGQLGSGPVAPVFAGSISSIFQGLDNCDTQITPGCLRALYDFVYTPLSGQKNSFGITEYTPQAYVPSDLDMFAKNFSTIGPSLVGARPVLNSIDGGAVQEVFQSFYYNAESNLDFQYAMNLVTSGQRVQLYQAGDILMGASFDNFLDAIDGTFCTFEGGDNSEYDGVYPDPLSSTGYKGHDCGTIKPANVISTSYAYNEADLSPAYAARQCAEYAKLGLMGITMLYSSGDGGVAGNSGACLNPDGSQSATGKIFNPTFPGTCPFVTAVGATQVNPGAKVTDPESACMQNIFSGGGFSNYFAMPDYQKTAVKGYLAANPPPYSSTTYNTTGSRAYPDLSANGANYVVALNGGFSLVSGTSASAPVVASILAMINDARLAIGKAPIGFINPTIYSPPFQIAFNDITTGSNPGCGTEGFAAARGFDPVTGVGTPSFAKLLVLWLVLP